MAFKVGQYQDSPLLNAYATTKQLKQKDRALDQDDIRIQVDKDYKEGLITNQERQILLGENELAHKKDVYDTTGKDFQESQTSVNNQNVKTSQYNIDELERQKALKNVLTSATSTLNDQFSSPKDLTSADLINYDSKTGNYSFNEAFNADNFGVSKNANEMRKQLVTDLQAKYPNLSPEEIQATVNDNWTEIYGQNMNSQYHDMNQFLTQAWQDEYQNADTNGDGQVSAEESKAINDKLSELFGQNPEFRNIMSTGLMAGGMDPSLMMYNIGGTNVPIGGDAYNYERIKQGMKNYTYEMEINDKTGMPEWKKVEVKNDVLANADPAKNASGSASLSGGNTMSGTAHINAAVSNKADKENLLKEYGNYTMVGKDTIVNNMNNLSNPGSDNYIYKHAYKDANGEMIYVQPKKIDWTKVESGNKYDVHLDGNGNKAIYGYDSGILTEWIPDAFFTSSYLKGSDLDRGKGLTALIDRQHPANIYHTDKGLPYMLNSGSSTRIYLPTVD